MTLRAPSLRRSWLFVPGGDLKALQQAPSSGADVLIQELEDFTPPQQRPQARAIAAETYAAWRAAGVVAAVRINPLETDGREDLAAIVPARPDCILMSKVAEPDQVKMLDAEVARLERQHGLPPSSIELVPNIESARGIMQTYAIAKASERITCVAGSTEDLAADLGAPRSKAGVELAYVRQRLHLECVAAGVVAVDCPYTFVDSGGCRADVVSARQLGYVAKSAVDPAHIAIINEAMTPSIDEIGEARTIVEAFERARAEGRDRARHGDLLVEVPSYLSAKRLLARAEALTAATRR